MEEKRILEIEGIKKETLNKIKGLEFKKEHLGALEFTFPITTEEFEHEDVKFRIERTSADGFLRIVSAEEAAKRAKGILENMVAEPVEARKAAYFKYSSEEMQEILEIASIFQNTPILFKQSLL